MQVTNATERTLELRALMGARDASDAWDLRCHVREELVGYLQREFPQALHRLRTDFTNQMPPLDQQPDVPLLHEDAFSTAAIWIRQGGRQCQTNSA